MRKSSVSILGALLLLVPAAFGATASPAGMGQAAWWVHPCQMFDKQVTERRALPNAEQLQASLCQGFFTGVSAMNFTDPPLLPFCESEVDTTIAYVRTFLNFMRANPDYADKQIGFAVLVALGRQYPKAECSSGAR